MVRMVSPIRNEVDLYTGDVPNLSIKKKKSDWDDIRLSYCHQGSWQQQRGPCSLALPLQLWRNKDSSWKRSGKKNHSLSKEMRTYRRPIWQTIWKFGRAKTG